MNKVRVGIGPAHTRRYTGKLEAGRRLVSIPLRDFRDYDTLSRPSPAARHLRVDIGPYTLKVVRITAEDCREAHACRGPSAPRSDEQDGPGTALDEPRTPKVPAGGDGRFKAWAMRVLKRVRDWLGIRRK